MTESDRQQLVIAYVPFAGKCVAKIVKRLPASIDVDELMADAYFGLVLAARKFDPSRGFDFSTYARKYVNGQVMTGLRKRSKCSGPATVSIETPAENGATTVGEQILSNEPPVGRRMETQDEVAFVVRRIHAKGSTTVGVLPLRVRDLAHDQRISKSAACQRLKRARAITRTQVGEAICDN